MKAVRGTAILLLILSLMLADAGLSFAAAESTLILPNDLQVIEEEAFAFNTSIEQAVLPGQLQQIGARAFADSSLRQINLPSSLTYIAEDAFENCSVHATADYGTYAYQYARDHEMLTDELTVTGNPITQMYIMTGKAASFPYNIASDLTWTASSDEDWITPIKRDDGHLSVVLSQNTGAEEREGTVCISNGAEEKTIDIHQSMVMNPPTISVLSQNADTPTPLSYKKYSFRVNRVYTTAKLYYEIYTVSPDGTEAHQATRLFSNTSAASFTLDPAADYLSIEKGGVYKIVIYETPVSFSSVYKKRQVFSSYYVRFKPDSEETDLTEVTLNHTSLSLNPGETETLRAYPNSTVTVDTTTVWSTSDSAVATVDSATGKVEALASGTAEITASVTSALGTTKTASCQVTVSQAATGISLPGMESQSHARKEIAVDEAVVLDVQITPENADDPGILWEITDPDVIEAAYYTADGVTYYDKVSVTGLKKGSSVIWFKSASNPDVKISCTVFVDMTAAEGTPLDTPSNIRVSTDGNRITVMWSGVENATGYTIYCADGDSGSSACRTVDVPGGSSTSGVVENLMYSKLYMFTVAAYSDSAVSNPSSAAVVMTGSQKIGQYTVTYDANGGDGAPEAQTKREGADLTLSSQIPVRPGYAFLGWATDSAFTAPQYYAGGVYKNNGSITLYAVWAPTETPTPIPAPPSPAPETPLPTMPPSP